jgi:transposase-like protein
MRGKAHSDETKSAAIAALLTGQGVSEVARKYKLPESTVSGLKKTLTTEQFEEVRSKKQDSLAGLIEGHLHASLKAAAAIATQANNADWRNKQDADKLGVFYGILTDKSVRILEAAESATAVEEEWPEHV